MAGSVLAQANTGKITGKVTAEGEALPGVTVTATSPSLQGERSDVSRETGDFLFPQLPAGEYELVFELEGFAPLRMPVKVNANQSVDIAPAMMVSNVEEEIVVTGELDTISAETQSQTTYEIETIEHLAITRSIEDAVVLAPGVHQTGPKATSNLNGLAISIAGSQSYENLFMVNGVVVNENTRGQAIEFVIEDAVQETTISTSGVSAEYGRFNGGVVNVITRSGGNEFHGSARVNVDKEAWEGSNQFTPENQNNDANETYEATFGGRILRDKLWFFAAGRDLTQAATQDLPLSQIPLDVGLEADRAEAKLTVSPHPSHRVIGSYMERNSLQNNEHFSAIDLSTVNPTREDPEDLTSVNYTGVLTPNFFLEAQWSERNLVIGKGSGGKTTERIGGTWFVDLTQFVFLASPTFCAVCVDNERNNENALLKTSFFLTTERTGSHDLVAGFDTFEDINVIENHQSGSDFHVWATQPFIVRGQQVFPQFTDNNSNIFRWTPVLESTQGMHFKTDSLFVNDTWRLGDKWSFNVGLRYDENDSSNGSGEVISDDTKLSPRLAAAYDLNADGNWVFNATYGHYASSINTGSNIGGVTGSAGALGDWQWLYDGPAINPDRNAPTDQLLNADEALEVIFAWFDSIGGVDNTDRRQSLTIPGLGLQVRESLVTPSAEEATVGMIKRLGTRGLVRADVVHREYDEFYSRRVDTGTGQVTNPDGSLSDLNLMTNSDEPERKYDGLHSQFSYRFNDRFTLAGNWAWSNSRGNFDGETEGNAALPWGGGAGNQGDDSYPELKAFARHLSSGHLQNDQRHKVALWGLYDVLQGEHNRLTVSLLQRFGSGRPFLGSELQGSMGQVASIDFVDVAALGYVNAPTQTDYWFYDRDAFLTDDIHSTDIAINYAFAFGIAGKELEVFVQPEILNVFNNDSALFVDSTILDARNGMAPFNPFTQTPVEGEHYAKGPNFGQPLELADLQVPRTFRFSVGFRF
jgi:outer membrane receptor protein involved in Fe transport